MDQLKEAVRPLADKGDPVDHKRRGQGGQRALQMILRQTQLVIVQRSCQRYVKPELIQDIGIAPAQQVRVLAGRQPRGATAGNLCVDGGRTKHVETLHAICRQRGQLRLIAHRDQCKEAAQTIQSQSIQADAGLRLGELRNCRVKVARAMFVCQREGRLEGGMQTIFARGLRHGGDARHVRLRHGTTCSHIPAQPSRSGGGKGLHAGHEIDGVSHEL